MYGHVPPAGDIVLYDKKTSGTCKQMGAVRAPAVTAEWSPDGRMLLTATTAPRMRVDNNLKVYTYYGMFVALNPKPQTPSPTPQTPNPMLALGTTSRSRTTTV